MKKILLILLVFYNFSFAGTYFSGDGICKNGQIYHNSADGYDYVSSIGDNSYNNCSWEYNDKAGTFSYFETTGLPDAKCSYYVDQGDDTTCLHEYYVKLYKNDCADDEHLDLDTGECVSDCPDGYKADSDTGECVLDCADGYYDVNGTCVKPLCDGVNNFLLSDGTCSGCSVSSFLIDVTCNCNSIGSSYTPKPVMTVTEIVDNIVYDFSLATCDNGATLKIGENPRPVDSSTSDVTITENEDNETNTTTITSTYTDNETNISYNIDSSLAAVSKILTDNLDKSNLAINSNLGQVNDNLVSMNTNLGNKINTTNSKLDTIGQKIDNFSSNFDLSSITFPSVDDFTSFSDSVLDDLETLKTNFTNTYDLIQQGFEYTPLPRNECLNPSIDFHGTTLTIDLCTAFSMFRPIVTFIFTLVGLFVSLRIYLWGLAL